MHLVTFQLENFKGISAFEMNPQGKSAVIEGRNGAGKTSVLDGIYFLLTGKGVDQPVRDGADKAVLEGVVGDLLVRRRLKADGRPELTVKGADGKPLKDAADVLRRLVGSGSAIRPLRIFGLKDSEQRDEILAALDVSVVEETQRENVAYEERTGVKKVVKAASDRVDQLLQSGAASAPNAPLEAKDALAAITEAEAREKRERERADRVAQLQKALATAHAVLQAASETFEAAEAALSEAQALPADAEAPAMLQKAREAFAGIAEHNARHLRFAELQRERQALKAASAKVEELDAIVDKARADRGAKLEAAAALIGVPALKFTDDGVTKKNVRLAELCHAEQVDLGLRIFLPAMKRQGIRLSLIDEAGSLDDDTIRTIDGLARENGIQVIFARAKTGAELEVEIIDGGMTP